MVADASRYISRDMDCILLLDDGSTDQSGAILDQMSGKFNYIQAIHHKKNQGYGASMQDALVIGKQQGYDFVITMDCDRQHRPEDIQRFIDKSPDIDIVSGSRYMPQSGHSGVAPEDRVEINGRIVKMLNRKFGWYLTDAFCGFKRYRLDRIELSFFQEQGYAFPLEFWAYAAWSGLSIEEISVQRIYTTDDRSFGEDLDKKRKRFLYYLRTFYAAQKRLKSLFSQTKNT